MPFDPLGIQEYHDDIRVRIEAGEPGFAQSFLGDVMVSYEAASFQGPVFAFNPLKFSFPPNSNAILEEIIIDVAHGEGIASPSTFRRSRIVRMVEDRQAYPPAYPKMSHQSELLKYFYLKRNSEGKIYLF